MDSVFIPGAVGVQVFCLVVVDVQAAYAPLTWRDLVYAGAAPVIALIHFLSLESQLHPKLVRNWPESHTLSKIGKAVLFEGALEKGDVNSALFRPVTMTFLEVTVGSEKVDTEFLERHAAVGDELRSRPGVPVGLVILANSRSDGDVVASQDFAQHVILELAFELRNLLKGFVVSVHSFKEVSDFLVGLSLGQSWVFYKVVVGVSVSCRFVNYSYFCTVKFLHDCSVFRDSLEHHACHHVQVCDELCPNVDEVIVRVLLFVVELL
jgi:hypothetical protein